MTAARSRPHALYVAWGFPPSRGGGVYRALATANGLVAAGFDVTVLTCEREAFERYTGLDASLEEAIHPEIEVVRLPFAWPAKEMDIREWSADRAQDPAGWKVRQEERDRRDFPETSYGHWAAPLEAATLEIHQRRAVDLVIGTANPNVDLVPALALHRRFGVPFVYDHRDAWTLHLYTEEIRHLDDPRVGAIEAELMASAAEVWFVNEPISAWHRARYPDQAAKIHTVPNGFDREFTPHAQQREHTDAPVRFGYIGTITSYMPMAELVDGWRIAATEEPAMAGATADFWGYLGFYGTPDRALSELFQNAAGTGVSYRGPVPKTEVQQAYAEIDVLLLVLGAGRFITSGKVYEYMATGLPVVSVHDPMIDSTRVLSSYPNWFPAASTEPADVADAFAAAARAVREGTLAPIAECVAFAESFERSRVLGPRLEGLRALVMA